MRLAFSIASNPTRHIAGRYTDSKGRKRTAERTWCGIVLGLGWRIIESEREPTCEQCIECHGERAA